MPHNMRRPDELQVDLFADVPAIEPCEHCEKDDYFEPADFDYQMPEAEVIDIDKPYVDDFDTDFPEPDTTQVNPVAYLQMLADKLGIADKVTITDTATVAGKAESEEAIDKCENDCHTGELLHESKSVFAAFQELAELADLPFEPAEEAETLTDIVDLGDEISKIAVNADDVERAKHIAELARLAANNGGAEAAGIDEDLDYFKFDDFDTEIQSDELAADYYDESEFSDADFEDVISDAKDFSAKKHGDKESALTEGTKLDPNKPWVVDVNGKRSCNGGTNIGMGKVDQFATEEEARAFAATLGLKSARPEKLKLTEAATISVNRAEFDRRSRAYADAVRDIAQFKVKLQRSIDAAGDEHSIPDYSDVPEADLSAAKAAYAKYEQAVKAFNAGNMVISESVSIKEMVDNLEDHEDEVECKWCGELTPKSDCRKEISLGWLCPQCQQAIKSRGEKLTFEEGCNK